MSYKSDPQEFPTRVSHKSVPQECPRRVSHKSVLQECHLDLCSFLNMFAFGFVGAIFLWLFFVSVDVLLVLTNRRVFAGASNFTCFSKEDACVKHFAKVKRSFLFGVREKSSEKCSFFDLRAPVPSFDSWLMHTLCFHCLQSKLKVPRHFLGSTLSVAGSQVVASRSCDEATVATRC